MPPAAGRPPARLDSHSPIRCGCRPYRKRSASWRTALKDPPSGEGRLPAADDAAIDSEAGELIPLVYDRLRSLARHYLANERPGHTLRPTELVHEAYLRLAGGDGIAWRGKTHFYAVAATQMRRILVEHARAGLRQKRGGRPQRITLSENVLRIPAVSVDVLALHEALIRLSRRHERQGRVAELRLFSGMLVREVATTLDVSEATVKGDWRVAKAWLLKELRMRRPVA